MARFLIGLLFFSAAAAAAAPPPLPPPPASCSGRVNAQPPLDGDAAQPVAAVANGTRWSVAGANLSTPLTVLHLYGDVYSMNFAYGALMAAEVQLAVPATLLYLFQQVNASYNLSWLPEPVRDWVVEYGVEAALDYTFNATLPFTPPHWADAVAGLAAGSGVGAADIRRVAMLAEWTRAQCSMLGAWGAASATGGLVQLRALDWDTDGPFQQWPVLAVYHPDAAATGGGVAHATLGWAGMLGAITGVSAAGVGISEKVWDAYSGPYSALGYAWNLLLQDALMFDTDTDQVLSRIASANRTCSIWIGVGDARGNGGGGSFKAIGYSSTTVAIYNDRNCRKCADGRPPTTRGFLTPAPHHLLYSDLPESRPLREPGLHQQARAALGRALHERPAARRLRRHLRPARDAVRDRARADRRHAHHGHGLQSL